MSTRENIQPSAVKIPMNIGLEYMVIFVHKTELISIEVMLVYAVAVGRESMVCCRLFRICSAHFHRQMGLILCTSLPLRPTSEGAGQQSITNRKSIENTFHLFSISFRRVNNLYPIFHYWFTLYLYFPYS